MGSEAEARAALTKMSSKSRKSPYRQRVMAEYNEHRKLRKRIIAQMKTRGDSEEEIEAMKKALSRHNKREGRRLGIFK